MLSQEIAFKFPKYVLRRPRRQEHVSEPRLLHAPGRGGVRHGPRAQDGGSADVDRLFGSAFVNAIHGPLAGNDGASLDGIRCHQWA